MSGTSLSGRSLVYPISAHEHVQFRAVAALALGLLRDPSGGTRSAPFDVIQMA
jgi:hypothetical protein